MDLSLYSAFLVFDYSKLLYTAGHTYPFTPIRSHIHSLMVQSFYVSYPSVSLTHSRPFMPIYTPLTQQWEQLGVKCLAQGHIAMCRPELGLNLQPPDH